MRTLVRAAVAGDARAVRALARRKRDPAAIAALAQVVRALPESSELEVAAIALADRKEPRAVTAAIACVRVLAPDSRARYFIVQRLAGRTERDRALRAKPALATLLLEVVEDGCGEERGEAMWGLMRIAAPRTMPRLIALLADRDAYIAATAARTLVRIARPAGLAAVAKFAARCDDDELVEELEDGLRRAARRRRTA